MKTLEGEKPTRGIIYDIYISVYMLCIMTKKVQKALRLDEVGKLLFFGIIKLLTE
jgi:hypothetical protein